MSEKHHIEGLPFWKDTNRWYIQDNNSAEAIDDDGLSHCGSSVPPTLLAMKGYNVLDFQTYGTYKLQPEDVLSLYFNDPRNEDKLFLVRRLPEFRGHMQEVPQYYPTAIKDVFNKKAIYIGYNYTTYQVCNDHIVADQISRKKITWSFIKYCMQKQYGIQVALKKPAHYIGIVAFDFTTNELIYYDPWKGNYLNKNGGVQERMSKKDFEKNNQGYCIVFL